MKNFRGSQFIAVNARRWLYLRLLITLCLLIILCSGLRLDPARLTLYAPLYAQSSASYTLGKDSHNQPLILAAGAGAVITLADVKNGLNDANGVHLLDLTNGKWRLNTSLQIGAGVTLNLSPAAGVVELQLRSGPKSLVTTNEVEAINYSNFVFLIALDGAINIDSVKIYSWNAVANAVDANYSDGRAYILAKYASTLNIRNADIGYLGSSDGESYGISWRDQNDPNLPNTLRTRVTGEMINSDIHHNYYGIYTFQAQNMLFRGNRFHHNVKYGFDPHDYSHHVLVENNVAYNNGAHGFIISRGCNNFIFRNNLAYDNFDPTSNQAHGFMLDPGGANIDKPQVSSSFNLLENNEAYGNEGFGLRLLGSADNEVRNNNFHHNYMGISLDLESFRNHVHDNQLTNNTLYGIHLRETSYSNTVTNNQLNENGVYGIYIRSSDNIVNNNTVRRNQQSGIAFLPISSSSPVRNNQLTDNTVIENGGNGIDVRQSPQNRLEKNAIAQNGGHGIFFGDGAKQNTLVGNTIYNNSGFGISASTSTSSGNHWSQNAVYANLGGGITLVQGANGNLAAPLLLATANNRLTGQAKANATVEIFADSTTQGQFFQGQTTTDSSGNFIFIQAGNWFAPNLTAIVLDSAGNASPFSAPITATGTVATPAATVATATPTDMPTATATATATNTPPNTPTTTAIVSPPATFTPTATATTIATATATTTTTAQATRTTTPTPVVANQPNHRTYLPTIFR